MTPRSPSATTAKPVDGYFQCGSCKKYYNRADHLIRHVRSHTREKPYACHICQKGFARPDLMKRHAAGHDREGFRKQRSSVVEQHIRVSQACKFCAASKLKCDEEKPCQRCREKDIVCEWPQDTATDASSSEQPSQQVIEFDHDNRDHLGQSPVVQDMLEPSITSPPIRHEVAEYPTPDQSRMDLSSADLHQPENYILATPLSPLGAPAVDPAISPTDQASSIFSVDGTFFPEFISGSLPPSLSRMNEMNSGLPLAMDYSRPDAYNNINMELDFDLTEVDYGIIDFFNTNGVNQGIHSNVDSNDEADSEIALGVDAFHRSSLSAWKPNNRDHAFADQDNLSVSRTVVENSDGNTFHSYQVLCERLTTSSRDLILGMVLHTSQQANRTRIIKSFPSTELLDKLIQDYFVIQQQDVCSWIHCPTFQPNNEGSEILAALASAGAALSPISAIRKLGYALMEIARLRIPALCENDNSVTRDLRLLQSYALLINVGLWSGNRRRMEIAESSEQNLVTMLRRALRYRRSKYPHIIPETSDVGPELEEKWRRWVEQESYKRLVYQVFLHDSQASITLHINPLISYADLELPLPGPRRLWEAKSATEWKEIYLSLEVRSRERIPSLADLLHDMSQLQTFECYIDAHLASFVLLHGITALIIEYHRLKFMSRGQSKHWQALIINSRHQELCAALQHFRTVCSALSELPRPEVHLFYEVASIFLYASVEDLQLFAGKEDKNEARRVYHSALEWIDSVDSRRAILHAGQAIRAAKSIPVSRMRNFMAFTVYHAGLAFWAYSVVSRSRNKLTRSSGMRGIASPSIVHSSHMTPVFLDTEDTAESQRFISLACGDPALHGPQGLPVYVADVNQIMYVVQEALRKDVPNEALQPLVLNLCQLMEDLGNAAGAHTATAA